MSEFYKNSELARANTAELTQEARDLNSELREQLGLQRRISEEDRVLIKLSQDLTRSAAENNVELRRSGKLERQLIKDTRNLTQLLNEESILRKSLTGDQVEGAELIARFNEERILAERELTRLGKQLANASEKEAEAILEQIKLGRIAVEDAEKELQKALEGADAETQRLALVVQSIDKQKELIDNRKQELVLGTRINENLGLTGAILDNLNKAGLRAFGGLGINLGTFQKSLSETIKEAEELAEELEGVKGEGLSDFGKKLKVFGVSAKGAFKALSGALFDPLIVFKELVEEFSKFEKVAIELSRETGQSSVFAASLSDRFATAADIGELIVEQTKQTGLNIQNVFPPETLAAAAEFKNMMGGTAEEASGLLTLTSATGATTDEILKNTVDTVNAFNGANKAAISQRGVLRDVLTTTDGIKASLAGNPEALAKAAASARKLGLSLSEVDQIADKLLDFESSIGSELEAQLLTGRAINLTKARELALNNDLAGLSEEIFKNQVSVAEFSQMNRIQQEGLASALGMSRDQLAKMAFQQARLNGMTAEQAALAAGVSLQDMQRVAATEALQKSLSSLLQLLSPIFDLFSKFFGAAANFPNLTRAVLALGIAFKLFKKSTVQAAAAQLSQVAATTTQTTANTLLAGSQATLTTTSNTAAVASRGFGAGLASLAAGGMAAVPVLLSIAAAGAGIGAAFAGIGFGIKMAAEGIIMLVNSLTLEKVKVLAAAAKSILALSGALGAFAITGVLALPALLAVTPLIKNMADTSGQAGTATGEGSLKAVEEKLDKLIEVVQKGGNVYIDGNKAGEALVLGSYKSS